MLSLCRKHVSKDKNLSSPWGFKPRQFRFCCWMLHEVVTEKAMRNFAKNWSYCINEDVICALPNAPYYCLGHVLYFLLVTKIFQRCFLFPFMYPCVCLSSSPTTPPLPIHSFPSSLPPIKHSLSEYGLSTSHNMACAAESRSYVMLCSACNDIYEKLGASDWLKTSVFSCNTNAKF